MKFRYKLLTVNIILFSVGLCIFGYFFLSKNQSLLLQNQIETAISQNNLIQANVEYQIFVALENGDKSMLDILSSINDDLLGSFNENTLDLFLLYDNKLAYNSLDYMILLPEELITNSEIGKKKYMLIRDQEHYFIYTVSCTSISEKNLYTITRNNITGTHTQIMEQLTVYRRITLFILMLSCASMLFISFFLTKPLESLMQTSKEFGSGNFSARADVKVKDEIGELAETYNLMANSVENHVTELNAMIQRQDQFIADFSHEVKTPMTAIIGYSDILRSKELTRDDQITAANFIFSEGKRLESMSQKLFDFIYTKQHKIEQKEINTRKLTDSIVQSVQYAMKEKELSLICDCEEKIIYGDELLLKSAFINLIDNARKASASGNKILFSAMKTDEGYLFAVQDFGIGIAPEHLSKITDEFYMVDKSRSRSEGGAGLGLSLAALIFQCHDATFKIDSTLGQGTTITVLFSHKKGGSQL